MERDDLFLSHLPHFPLRTFFLFRCDLVVAERVRLHVPGGYRRVALQSEVLVHRLGGRSACTFDAGRRRACSTDGMKVIVSHLFVCYLSQLNAVLRS